MGRPSNREQRRKQILAAFAKVLGDHGYAGATIAAVADEAGVAPGLIHHHFQNKAELLSTLLAELMTRFRSRVRRLESRDDPLTAYVQGALRLDDDSDLTAARCWVGVFAEAVRNPALYKQLRRALDAELVSIQARSGHTLSSQQAAAVLAFVIGALVLGAFAPENVAGFAAPALQRLVETMRYGFGADP